MINKQIVTILLIIILLPSTLWASWNTPDKGYFNTQKDIEKTVSDYSRSSATIAFGGKLYNFIVYGLKGCVGKVIVRKLTNIGKSGSIKWKCKKDDDFPTLKGLSWAYYQPAPVVFKDQLILFVGDGENNVSYSTYNSGAGSWSSLTRTFDDFLPVAMSAVAIGNRLCLVTIGYDGEALLSSTEDLVEWVTTPLDLPDLAEHAGWAISAVTQTYMKGKTLEEKLLIGYINTSQHARCAEYDLDLESGKFTKIINKSIASDQKYSSVALCQGSVTGDPDTGNMVQAFLKKAKLDNGYQRVRILRYQSIVDENGASGDWTRKEKNLVKQNYLWASKNVNLTAANFPVTDGETINQYMCLIYRGYDDFDHPLNCAWVETDKLQQIGTDKQTLTKPENVQYIGYIEGLPPFYKNNEDKLPAPLNGPTAEWISSVSFAYDKENKTEENTKFAIELKVGGGFKGFKGSLSEEYGHSKDVVTTTTISHEMSAHPTDGSIGYYITLQPVMNRADYDVYDVHDTYLYTTYYFWMSAPHLVNESVSGLADSRLNPQFPGTYMYRDKYIHFDSFDSMVDKGLSTDVSWTIGIETSVDLEITEETETTNTSTGKVKLGYEAGEEHIWEVGIELSGSVDVEVSTTTKTGNKVTCTTDLNEPDVDKDTDLTDLDYTVHWLKPTEGCDNWWLHPGQDPKQKTWCITYEVHYMRYKDGREFPEQ